MGLFRKMTSISTMGAVDFRSDKERIARYTKQTRNATRALVDQQSDEVAAEFREFQQWKADREATQQRQDRVIRERERMSDVARQERARREREQASLDAAAKATKPTPEASTAGDRTAGDKAAAFVAQIMILTFLAFIVLEIAGIRLGWWWASIGVMLIAAGCVSTPPAANTEPPTKNA